MCAYKWFLVSLALVAGCSSSTQASFQKKDVPAAIVKIAADEYQTDIKARLAGSTLWLYVPLDKMFDKADKPEKYSEKFQIAKNEVEFEKEWLRSVYSIKVIPVKENKQEYKIEKTAAEKMQNALKILRRVIFSTDKNQQEDIKFYVIAAGDLNSGVEIRQLLYYRDLKKVSYGLLSFGEFQHRVVQETFLNPAVIKDRTGKHLEYTDMTLADFVAKQISYRIKLKFSKPEVEQTADIDREVAKIISETLRIYELDTVKMVELTNEVLKRVQKFPVKDALPADAAARPAKKK